MDKSKSSEKIGSIFIVEGSVHVLEKLERFLRYLQHCSSIGHTATVAFEIDGDGPDRFKLKSLIHDKSQIPTPCRTTGRFERID